MVVQIPYTLSDVPPPDTTGVLGTSFRAIWKDNMELTAKAWEQLQNSALRPYQRKLITEITKSLELGQPLEALIPIGAGKSEILNGLIIFTQTADPGTLVVWATSGFLSRLLIERGYQRPGVKIISQTFHKQQQLPTRSQDQKILMIIDDFPQKNGKWLSDAIDELKPDYLLRVRST